MSEFDKILLTAFLTIMGGFLIHSASQLFLKVFIEPMQQYRKYRAEAISLLSFYSNMLSSRIRDDDGEDYISRYFKAQDEIRMCMANIKASYYSISPRWLAILFGIIPKQSEFQEITSNLLTLSFLGSLNTERDGVSKNMDLAKNTIRILGAKW